MSFNPSEYKLQISGDDFDSVPSRRRGLLKGLKGHVSAAHTDHLSSVARQIGGRATDFAASNPDAMERIGERVGGLIGGAVVSPFLGRKAGKRAGKKVGRMLSDKAQSGGGSQIPSNPFGDGLPKSQL